MPVREKEESMLGRTLFVGFVGLFLLAAPLGATAGEKNDNWGSGALCEKCRKMGFTADIGVCKECKRGTSSGAFKLCQACGRRLGRCQACGAPLAGGPAPAAEPPRGAQVSGNTHFACELYAKLREQEGNLFFSPYSISSALAMTYAGARGNTAAEMKKSLRFIVADGDLHPAFASLTKALNEGGKGGSYELAVANALWGQKDYAFLPDFLALNRKHYGAGLELVDFAGATEKARGTINAWVERQTREKIKDLLKPGILTPLTRLVLTNAIYFKGDWAKQFKKEATREAPFQVTPGKSVKVPTMNQTEKFGYMETPDLQALSLPYEGEALSMVVFLPKKADGLAAFEKSLTAENLAKWLPRLRTRRVAVSLPRFKVTAEFGLKPTLEAMGMKDAFTMAADFSGMEPKKELYISAIVHKAFVDVNEEGTEAAAATAVVMTLKSAPARPLVFKADHPFVFVIREDKTGSVLFMGRVANPKPE